MGCDVISGVDNEEYKKNRSPNKHPGCMGEQYQMRMFAFGTTSPGERFMQNDGSIWIN